MSFRKKIRIHSTSDSLSNDTIMEESSSHQVPIKIILNCYVWSQFLQSYFYIESCLVKQTWEKPFQPLLPLKSKLINRFQQLFGIEKYPYQHDLLFIWLLLQYKRFTDQEFMLPLCLLQKKPLPADLKDKIVTYQCPFETWNHFDTWENFNLFSWSKDSNLKWTIIWPLMIKEHHFIFDRQDQEKLGTINLDSKSIKNLININTSAVRSQLEKYALKL